MSQQVMFQLESGENEKMYEKWLLIKGEPYSWNHYRAVERSEMRHSWLRSGTLLKLTASFRFTWDKSEHQCLSYLLSCPSEADTFPA